MNLEILSELPKPAELSEVIELIELSELAESVSGKDDLIEHLTLAFGSAVYFGQTQIAIYLLKLGANVNLRCHWHAMSKIYIHPDRDFRTTILGCMIRCRNLPMVIYLLDKCNADPHVAINEGGLAAVSYLESLLLHHKSTNSNKDYELWKVFLDRNMTDRSTTISFLFQRSDNAEIQEEMFNMIIDLRKKGYSWPGNHYRLLCDAIQGTDYRGRYEPNPRIRFLLNHGININDRDDAHCKSNIVDLNYYGKSNFSIYLDKMRLTDFCLGFISMNLPVLVLLEIYALAYQCQLKPILMWNVAAAVQRKLEARV